MPHVARGAGRRRLALTGCVAALALVSPAAALAGGSVTVTGKDGTTPHVDQAHADDLSSVLPGGTLSSDYVRVIEDVSGGSGNASWTLGRQSDAGTSSLSSFD